MLPDRINICGVPHTIYLCDDVFDVDTHFGQIEYSKAIIKINKDMPEEMQRLTLCHEWLHGALVALGFQTENDEAFVTALATAINQTFTTKERQI